MVRPALQEIISAIVSCLVICLAMLVSKLTDLEEEYAPMLPKNDQHSKINGWWKISRDCAVFEEDD